MTTALAVKGISRHFGGLMAVNDVSFTVEQKEIFGVIGPNGAGKTTLFNLVSGELPVSSGKAWFQDQMLTGMTPDAIARLGIIRTFQATTSFKQTSVRENLRRAALFRYLSSPRALFGLRRVAEAQAAAEARAEEILAFVGLTGQAAVPAATMAYGAQKILGVGMAVAAVPKMMLMDEPAAGLNPTETKVMSGLIRRLRDELSITVLLVEHDMNIVMSLCDRILVLNYGQVVTVDTPERVRANPDVIEAYLGAADADA